MLFQRFLPEQNIRDVLMRHIDSSPPELLKYIYQSVSAPDFGGADYSKAVWLVSANYVRLTIHMFK